LLPLESLQLQRGVGNLYKWFGALAQANMLAYIAMLVKLMEKYQFCWENTRKHTVKFSTGLLNDHFELAGRLSVLKSDGYIDRASSDLKSYFLQGTYIGKTTLIKALAFGGIEKNLSVEWSRRFR
jgi:iron complex outermembrane receptor protein